MSCRTFQYAFSFQYDDDQESGIPGEPFNMLSISNKVMIKNQENTSLSDVMMIKNQDTSVSNMMVIKGQENTSVVWW